MRMRFLIYFLLFFAVTLRGQGNDPFSPSVTRSESERIQQALSEAEEDPEKGMALLVSQVTEKSTAAIDFTLGNLYFQEEMYAEAQKAYERSLEKFPAFRNAKINLGRIYLLLEEPERAIKIYQELVRDGIADGETYLLLGHALLMKSQPVSAESAYRQCLLLDQNLHEAKQGLLNSLLLQERHQEAVFLSRELLEKHPLRRDYWAARANAEIALGDHEKALHSLEQARRLGIADTEMYIVMGELYLQQNTPAPAVERFTSALKEGELSLSKHVQAVKAFIAAGALVEADRLFVLLEKKFSKMDEKKESVDEGTVLKLKSRLQMAQGNRMAAEETLQRVLDQYPMDGESLLLLSELQVEQGQVEEALLLLERAGRLKGFEADSLVQQALIQVGKKEIDLAVKLLERAQVFEERAQVRDYLRQVRRMAE